MRWAGVLATPHWAIVVGRLIMVLLWKGCDDKGGARMGVMEKYWYFEGIQILHPADGRLPMSSFRDDY
jgi:hypothetical protein